MTNGDFREVRLDKLFNPNQMITVNEQRPPQWLLDSANTVTQANKLATEEYEMKLHRGCRHCGKYCVYQYYKKRFFKQALKGRFYLRGKAYNLHDDENDQYNRSMRNGAILTFHNKFTLDLTEGYTRGYISMCVVEKIRKLFPSPSGIYHGYPWSREELEEIDPKNYPPCDTKPAAKKIKVKDE